MAELNLERDICFFDLETTGVDTNTAKIIQISLHIVRTNGEEITRTRYINPEEPIPAIVTQITGIKDEDVQNEPTFARLAKSFYEMIKDCDLAGFNSNRFDIPILIEEFKRAGIEFDISDKNLIDVMKIYHKMEARDLSAAYKFYCNKDLEGAHDASVDALATKEILMAQIDRYNGVNYVDPEKNVVDSPIQNNMGALHTFCGIEGQIDLAARFIMSEGQAVFNFGKHKGQPVKEVCENNRGYYAWMLKGDFTADTKNHLKAICQFETQEA